MVGSTVVYNAGSVHEFSEEKAKRLIEQKIAEPFIESKDETTKKVQNNDGTDNGTDHTKRSKGTSKKRGVKR